MDDITIIVVQIRNVSCFNTYDYPDPGQSYDNEEEQTKTNTRKTNETIKHLIRYDTISYKRLNYSITDFSGFNEFTEALTIINTKT